jgi:sortase A
VERVEAAAPAPKIKKKRVAPAADPTAVGRIEIPRLGVTAIVKEGADEGTLARAVGLVRGTARPGEVGNMVLAGHRDTFFRPLRNIKVNDRIRMIVPPNTYEYEVQSLRVVAPEETSVLDSKGVEELTLVTCFPFRFIGPAPDRFIVSATRVN